MGEETIAKVLKGFGLTDRETEVYIFLAKHGILKNREIARQMGKDRAQTLRILKSLQAKGLVEATLEAPTRYTSVPFERVVELRIKARKDEAALLETSKNELLSYWKQIGSTDLKPSPEKFVVIEGERKIYPKIAQMMKETRNRFSSISTVQGLLRGDQFGLFEAVINHPLKTKIQFRFLTEVCDQNLNIVKSLFKRTLKTEVNIKARNPDLGLRLFPRMVIRDNEEILYFIKPRTTTEDNSDLCLWTNCTDLVQAFTVVFEDLWNNSTDLETKIAEIETSKPSVGTLIINEADVAYKKYQETLHSAKTEIVMMISSEDLIELGKNESLLKQWFGRSVGVKIIAPITTDNLNAALKLSENFDVRHVPSSYLRTTIVDGKYLFQSKVFSANQRTPEAISNFADTFYTTDCEYIEKASIRLTDLWKNAQKPSNVSMARNKISPAFIGTHVDVRNLHGPFGKFPAQKILPLSDTLTEEDIINKMINAKRAPFRIKSRDENYMYASVGQAIIRPPKNLKLPVMQIDAYHVGKNSSLGDEDAIVVNLWRATREGYRYRPVAIVGDNPEAHAFWKLLYLHSPARQNVHLVSRDAIQVQVHGNTLFAAWTVPIPLLFKSYVLPPGALLFEGYGEVKTGKIADTRPDGSGLTVEFNSLEAFVTFMHPSARYTGPGTEGVLNRELIMKATPPRSFGDDSIQPSLK